MIPTIIIFGPPRWGKTTNAEKLRKKYNCLGVVDDFFCKKPARFVSSGFKTGYLHLTNLPIDQLNYWVDKAIIIDYETAIKDIE